MPPQVPLEIFFPQRTVCRIIAWDVSKGAPYIYCTTDIGTSIIPT